METKTFATSKLQHYPSMTTSRTHHKNNNSIDFLMIMQNNIYFNCIKDKEDDFIIKTLK